MKIKFSDKEIVIDSWFQYLYPYLLRFSLKNEIDISWKNDIIFISDEKREQFAIMLENILKELLDDCYIEPTHKQRSKYPSRYEKIVFQEKLYVLDYRTSAVGIIGYALNYLISEAKKY